MFYPCKEQGVSRLWNGNHIFKSYKQVQHFLRQEEKKCSFPCPNKFLLNHYLASGSYIRQICQRWSEGAFSIISGHELCTVWRRLKLKNKIWHSDHNRHIALLEKTQKQVKIGCSVYIYKTTRRRLPITFASVQALRLITFMQRFRTTRRLISIQLLWKPKILNVEDKRTKFELSKGDLGQFQESCKWSLTRVQLSKHMDLRCF